MMRQITLTENPDGRWTAYDTATKTVAQGDTRDDALDNLDDVAPTPGESGPAPVNPNDPIFNPTTFTAGEPTDTSERVDEILYGAEGTATTEDANE